MTDMTKNVLIEVKVVGKTDKIDWLHASKYDFSKVGEDYVDREAAYYSDDSRDILNSDFVIFERVSDGKRFASYTLDGYSPADKFKDDKDFVGEGIYADYNKDSGKYTINDTCGNMFIYIAESLIKCNKKEVLDAVIEKASKSDNKLLKLFNEYINDTDEHKKGSVEEYDEKYDTEFTYSDVIDAFSEYNCIFGIDDDDFFIDVLVLVNNM